MKLIIAQRLHIITVNFSFLDKPKKNKPGKLTTSMFCRYYKPTHMPLANLNDLININDFICLVYLGSINLGVLVEHVVDKYLPI